jgi:hypothetical protein
MVIVKVCNMTVIVIKFLFLSIPFYGADFYVLYIIICLLHVRFADRIWENIYYGYWL